MKMVSHLKKKIFYHATASICFVLERMSQNIALRSSNRTPGLIFNGCLYFITLFHFFLFDSQLRT